MAQIVRSRIDTNNQLLNIIPTLRSSKSVCKTSLSHHNQPTSTTVLSKKRGVSNLRLQRNDYLRALNTSKDARPKSFAAYQENLLNRNDKQISQRIPDSKVIIKPKSYQKMQYERNNQFGKRTCDEYQRSLMEYTTVLNSNEASTMYGDQGQSLEDSHLRTGGYSSQSFLNVAIENRFEARYKSS